MTDAQNAPAAGAAPTALEPPAFDHVFVTVAADTLAQINACRFVSEEGLGRFQLLETESSLIGRYAPARIFGESTMLELFPERFGDGEFEGVTVGLVFSFVRPGDHVAARERLAAASVPFAGELIRRTPPGGSEPAPFYHSTRPQIGPGGALTLFLSEITPEYLAGAGVPMGRDGRFDRAAYLTAGVGRPQTADHALADIVGVSLRLRAAHAERLAQVLQLAGFSRVAAPGGFRLAGAHFETTVVIDEAGERLEQVRMQLRRPCEARRFDFGRGVSLELAAEADRRDIAIWRFAPLA